MENNWCYAVVNHDMVWEFHSPVHPDEMVTTLTELKEVIKAVGLTEMELYVYENGVWRGIHGVADMRNVYIFVAPRAARSVGTKNQRAQIRSYRQADATLQELGHAVIRAYLYWRQQQRKLERQNPERAASSAFTRKIRIVDAILNGSPPWIQEVFDAKYRKGFSNKEIMALLYLSESTLYRYLQELKQQIGYEVLRHCQGDVKQIAEFISDLQFTWDDLGAPGDANHETPYTRHKS